MLGFLSAFIVYVWFTVDTVHFSMYLVTYSPIPVHVTCMLYDGSLCVRLKGSSPQPPVHSLVPRRVHRRLAPHQSIMPGLPDQDLILLPREHFYCSDWTMRSPRSQIVLRRRSLLVPLFPFPHFAFSTQRLFKEHNCT